MSQLQVSGEAKIRDIQGPVVANSGVITALDGAASQYVRGDGTLADFPTSTGGGSSVSYYLNSSVSQGTIGGVAYRELSKEPIIGAGTDITISANGYVASYITDANDPDVLSVPGGNFNCEFYFSVNNNTGNPTTYAELYKYDGTTFTLLGSSVGVPESINQGTTIAPYYFAIPVATAALALTDRLAIRIYVSVDGRVVTLHTENSHLCQVVTTFSKGMVSLNNLTDQSQFITTGTSGTNFNIVSSGDTHTFNLPVASATNTGKLSNTDWSTFNNKLSTATAAATYVPYTGATTSVDLGFNNFDANQINGFKIVAKLDGTSSGSLILRTGTSGYSYGNDSISLISSPTTANTLIITSDVSSVTKIAQFGLGSLTATRTFTLPDLSGTLALTSNIPSVSGTSTYIPVFTGTNSLGNSQIWNNGGIIGMGTNYSNPAFYVVASSGDTLTQGKLAINTTSFSGTSVLQVNGAATLTGALNGTTAAFSSFVNAFSFTAIGGTSNAGQISLKHTGAISVGDGYVTIAADSSNTLGIYFFNSFSAKFSISALTNNRTYTLPDGTGTLALTSNLSSYLPLTGGTLTGPLSGTSATFSGDLLVGLTSSSFQVANRNVVVVNGTSSALYGLVIGGVNKGYIYSDATSVRLMSLDASGFMSFGTNNTERMHINSSGNVGIGTSSPDYPLVVQANSSGAQAVKLLGRSVDNISILSFHNNANSTQYGYIAGIPSEFRINSGSSIPITFTNLDTERMRITSGGNVGIGTSSPGNFDGVSFAGPFFDVAGMIQIKGTSANTIAGLQFGGTTFRKALIYSTIGTEDPALIFATASSGSSSSATERMRITSGGNVGIGVTPASVGGITELAIGGASSNPNFSGIRDGANAFQLYSDSGGSLLYERRNLDLRFGTNNTERMRITSGGNVLINKTSLSAASFSASGTLQVNNEIVSTGSSAGLFWENRSGGVTSNSNWYGWYTASGTIYLYNGSGNIASINASTGAYTALSDINKKKDFEASSIGLDAILGLKPTLYRMKTDDENAQKQLGFIAQEVKEFIPQAYIQTKGEKEDFIGLDDRPIIAALVKAVQELKLEIDELKNK